MFPNNAFSLGNTTKNSLAGERPGRKKVIWSIRLYRSTGEACNTIVPLGKGTSLKFPSSCKFIVQAWCELFMNFG